MVIRHLAWFRRDTGQWLGEWKGELPEPHIPVEMVGNERERLMNDWLQLAQYQALLGTYHMHESIFDKVAFDECPDGGAVCLDVTRFNWPVGDHMWHKWDDVGRFLDWGEEHTFIEVDTQTGCVVGRVTSHRPVRPSLPNRVMLDVTHSRPPELPEAHAPVIITVDKTPAKRYPAGGVRGVARRGAGGDNAR
jgi:hypothetical protein